MTNFGFWKKIKKPIISLAPMLDVTDSAFRQIILKKGRPDVFFTWFVSADGLASEKGRTRLIKDLYFNQKERPIVAQIFGSKPENFYIATKIIKDLKFDGLDINMGCPDRKVLKQNSGASLIDNFSLSKKIIEATLSASGKMPVSIKTRLGNKTDVSLKWAKFLAKTGVSVITIHGRLAKDQSKYPADWQKISAFAKAVKSINPKILVFGNGDIKDIEEVKIKTKQYNLDGIMIGRAIFGNPWFFNKKIKKSNLSAKEIFKTLLNHLKLFSKIHSFQNPNLMKKHFSSYLSGVFLNNSKLPPKYNSLKKVKIELMKTKTLSEAEKIIEKIISCL